MSGRRIKITAGDVSVEAVLSGGTTANKLWDALPITGSANTWGDEIYFSIPLKAGVEPGASDVVGKGDIAYWPPGSAFCIFWGRTPASVGDEIRAASEVNHLGAIDGDAAVFGAVQGGTEVKIEKV